MDRTQMYFVNIYIKQRNIHHTDLSTVDSGINYFPFQHYVIRNDLWVDVT